MAPSLEDMIEVVKDLKPLPGAKEFLDWLKPLVPRILLLTDRISATGLEGGGGGWVEGFGRVLCLVLGENSSFSLAVAELFLGLAVCVPGVGLRLLGDLFPENTLICGWFWVVLTIFEKALCFPFLWLALLFLTLVVPFLTGPVCLTSPFLFRWRTPSRNTPCQCSSS